jgi:PAS domain-containing protein
VTSVDGSLASALVAALPDGVLVIDPAGVVVGANRRRASCWASTPPR